MGTTFTRELHECYSRWCKSRQGRAVESSLESLIVSVMDLRPGLRVLDIGCGAGNHLLLLSKMGLDVSGVDASPFMVEQARSRLGRHCILRTCEAEDLPFEDNEFDMVFMINTLEFVRDPLQVLKEAGRVASRQVFIGVFNSFSWSGLSNRIQGLFGNSMFRNARFFSLWDLKALVKAAYGKVPVMWKCILLYPEFLERIGLLSENWCTLSGAPFGTFIGMSATMLYTVRAHTLPLKVNLEDMGQSVTHTRVGSSA